MLALVCDVLATLPEHEANEIRGRVHEAMERVGRASGGLFGIGALSRPERRFMERVMSAG